MQTIDADMAVATRDPLTARMEEAALNATVVREQMLYDGWLMRWANAKARRARSINPIAAPLIDIEEKLAFCRAHYQRVGRPLIFRINSACADAGLDARLAQRGYARIDETLVMAVELPASRPSTAPVLRYETGTPEQFAEVTGALRDYGAEHVREHRQRLSDIAVPSARVLARDADGRIVGAGLAVMDGGLVGVFDVVVVPEARRRGYGRALVEHLLAQGVTHGARHAYLQVESGNEAARKLYGAMGFAERYRYWYRAPQAPQE
ncbi:GNAT family N-acetyltransferase [Achromobacter aloeverae]|uniref:N-acetyltransferase n=1 Tax=Achromobacter aloeverae TaxID=1750518 RepID=A0A4Q1HJC0_9BURK|nr:GNAT family N-acetyltransferase [Achromobacter aloeverae]RXN86653.1 N-acetyltransferase [Achromobacter aloeverae]